MLPATHNTDGLAVSGGYTALHFISWKTVLVSLLLNDNSNRYSSM